MITRLFGPGGARSVKEYYNRDRVHRGLNGVPPDKKGGITGRKIARLDDYHWEKHCRGLYQLPAAA